LDGSLDLATASTMHSIRTSPNVSTEANSPSFRRPHPSLFSIAGLVPFSCLIRDLTVCKRSVKDKVNVPQRRIYPIPLQRTVNLSK